MLYYVYLIIAVNSSKKISYVGYTKNLQKRLLHHNNNKGAKFTKGRKWKLIYYEIYNSKSKALKQEYELKKNQKLRKQIKNKYHKEFLV
ncbi:GIY-YIG nuclease family protein [Candidatus Pelagibacter sp. HIMB1493]|uniref:GIY-YIG nuclease family protein n=1 Tax=Candidatus Pelagibacter sp. HIMB1493 TaxID=3413334 RepID=UPI003F840946